MAYECYTANKDPRTGLYKPTEYKSTIEPYKVKVFEPKTYVDPLRAPLRTYEYKEFKSEPYKPPPFKPFTTLHTYKLPDVDPLTGRPRRPRQVPPPKEDRKPKSYRTKKQIKPIVFDETGQVVRAAKYPDTASDRDTATRKEEINTPVKKRVKKTTVNEYVKMMTVTKEKAQKNASKLKPETLEF